MKYIISGGGTGGHIFPAIAIGKALERIDKEAEILFVGAENRMEMEKVPMAGFNIIGLPIAGFNRSNLFKNIPVFFRLAKSLHKAKKIIRDWNPDVAIGVGGYASAPVLKAAQKKGIPTMLQEQNSYAGVANKMLAKNADIICVAYERMERFFPAEKLKKTGNPLRPYIYNAKRIEQKQAKIELGFDSDRPLIVAMGGSLGARTINDALSKSIDIVLENGYSILWQTGKRFYEGYCKLNDKFPQNRLKIVPFIDKMDVVYAAADIAVSRAGATTISELQFLGVAAVLVPSPNVAEDHQTKNAIALVEKGAALMVADSEAPDKLPLLLSTLPGEKEKLRELRKNVAMMGEPNSDEQIATLAFELATKHRKNAK